MLSQVRAAQVPGVSAVRNSFRSVVRMVVTVGAVGPSFCVRIQAFKRSLTSNFKLNEKRVMESQEVALAKMVRQVKILS
jgi:hypothetical protein